MVILSILGNIIGNLFGGDGLLEDDTVTPCFQPGVLLDSGILWVQLIRRFLIAGTVVEAQDKLTSHKCDHVCRASELPFYISNEKNKSENPLCPTPPSVIESFVSTVRKNVWSAYDNVKEQCDYVQEQFNSGSERAQSMVKYLSEECDDNTRMGAIGIAALTGYIFSLRCGIFKKIVYVSTAALGMTALCYPSQSYEYAQKGLKESEKYSKIAYNFIFGVNNNNKNQGFEFPQLPKTIDEAKDVFSRIGKSTSALISGSKECAPEDTSKKVINEKSEDVVKESYEEAIESCECPVGACLGRHDKSIAD